MCHCLIEYDGVVGAFGGLAFEFQDIEMEPENGEVKIKTRCVAGWAIIYTSGLNIHERVVLPSFITLYGNSSTCAQE